MCERSPAAQLQPLPLDVRGLVDATRLEAGAVYVTDWDRLCALLARPELESSGR